MMFPDRRKLLLNVSQVLFCAGAVAGPAVAGWLLPRGISWRWFFVGVGVLTGMLLVPFALCELSPGHAHKGTGTGTGTVPLPRLICRASVWVPALAIFLYVTAEMSVALYANAYLQRAFNAPERWAILSISLFWLSMGVGRAACALVPERWSYEKLIAGLAVAAAVCMFCQWFAPGWVSALLLFAGTGFAFAGIWPLIVGSPSKATHSPSC